MLQAKRTGYTTYSQSSSKPHHDGTAAPIARMLATEAWPLRACRLQLATNRRGLFSVSHLESIRVLDVVLGNGGEPATPY